jgi:hypothetical protein
MSGYTQTTDEVLYAFYGASTNLATFTAEDNLLKTFPACQIPGSIFQNTGARSTSLKIRACGQLGTTGTPTFTFSLRLMAGTTTWANTGLLLGSSGAVPASSTVLLAPWQLDADLGLVTLASAGSATTSVKTMGTLSGAGFSATGAIPANNVSPLLSTIDVSATYYLFLSCACSASNALNLINTQMFKVYGEN